MYEQKVEDMKKILITGSNSYIGNSVERWLNQYPDRYSTETVDLMDASWKEKDFSSYDVVFHVAGIAHVKETSENKDLYYKVNRDLAYETAKKAKAAGVSQFIFLSSMSVYGIEKGTISANTPMNPTSHYGKSKLQAEELIQAAGDDHFKVAILRPPMIYGKGCKGNYPKLARLALKVPFFPDTGNQRSMLYISNLCEFIRLLIDGGQDGFFFPQNDEYMNTGKMVKLIAEAHGRHLALTRVFNPLLRVLHVNTVNKVFGDLAYDMKMSHDKITNYCLFDIKNSLRETEI